MENKDDLAVKMEYIKIRTIDIKQAEELLSFNTYKAQRALRENHINELINAMNNGWTGGNIGIARLTYDNDKIVLVNGQHQCHAIIRSEKPIIVTLKKFIVDSPKDLAYLYRQFDQGATRSLANFALTEAVALNLDWPNSVVRTLISGAAIKESKQQVNKQEKVTLLKKYIKAGEAYLNILSVGGRGFNHLRRAAVVAAMLCTWEKNQEQSIKFWNDVHKGENLTKDMPQYTLREYLLSVTVSFSRAKFIPSKGSKINNVSEREMLSKCIIAWNAFRKSDKTALRYFSDKQIPKVI